MLTYEHGTTVLHRLDPRSKLLAQAGFAVAVFTHDSVLALVLLTGLALAVLAGARLSPVGVLRGFRFVLVVLATAPLFATLTFGSPWIVPARALDSIVAGYQVVLVLLVSTAYVRTTPVRETRATLQRHVPGKAGQLLGVGVGLVFRFFPLLWGDLGRIRLAIRARAGAGLSVRKRVQRISLLGVQRAIRRAETLSTALRARCFAWNPTLPHLQFTWIDYPVLVLGVLLVVSPAL